MSNTKPKSLLSQANYFANLDSNKLKAVLAKARANAKKSKSK